MNWCFTPAEVDGPKHFTCPSPPWPTNKWANTKMATHPNSHTSKRSQTQTATHPNGHTPKRPYTQTATHPNGHTLKWLLTQTAKCTNSDTPTHISEWPNIQIGTYQNSHTPKHPNVCLIRVWPFDQRLRWDWWFVLGGWGDFLLKFSFWLFISSALNGLWVYLGKVKKYQCSILTRVPLKPLNWGKLKIV